MPGRFRHFRWRRRVRREERKRERAERIRYRDLPPRGQYLVRATGHSDQHWVHAAQALINEYTDWDESTGHGDSETEAWVVDLARDVVRSMRGGGDPNMGAAAALGLILVTWYARIQRAKAYDPNRPVKLRQRALEAHRDYVALVMDSVNDESRDHVYFAGQKWDPPFAPEAKDGEFV